MGAFALGKPDTLIEFFNVFPLDSSFDFGKIGLGVKQAIKYNAALLLGTSEAAANRTFRMQVEYEF